MIRGFKWLSKDMKRDEKTRMDLANSYFEQGYHLQMRGHLDRAAHFYRRSIQFCPSARAHTFLGWIFSLKGRFNEAIESCKKAIELNPDYGNPYNDIGAYLIKQRKYRQAVPWLHRALNAPEYHNYCYPYFNLGHICEVSGDWDRALRYYRNAIEENPEYEPAQTAYDKLLGRYN